MQRSFRRMFFGVYLLFYQVAANKRNKKMHEEIKVEKRNNVLL